MYKANSIIKKINPNLKTKPSATFRSSNPTMLSFQVLKIQSKFYKEQGKFSINTCRSMGLVIPPKEEWALSQGSLIFFLAEYVKEHSADQATGAWRWSQQTTETESFITIDSG